MLNHGFSVETGTPSFSTFESFRRGFRKKISGRLATTGPITTGTRAETETWAPSWRRCRLSSGHLPSLEDFERKAQMLDYVDHRAIFEGMNAHLWAPNSGRMLWMTQPAWPSNVWQILNSDYDTQSSFYGVKKACEPLHVQLDLSNYDVAVVNTSNEAHSGLMVVANVYSLDNKTVLHREEKRDAPADVLTQGFRLELGPLLASDDLLFVNLELKDQSGKVLSRNFYWLGVQNSSYRRLNRLGASSIAATATSTRSGDSVQIKIELRNTGNVASIEDKLTLLNSDGSRILPAYYGDNYVSLMPGETREIEVEYPAKAASGAAQLSLRAWNLAQQTIKVQ